MANMARPPFQLSVAAFLGLVAAVAVNIWLFRLGLLAGIFGLSITKHIVIAYLCQVLGVDRRTSSPDPDPPPGSALRPPVTTPHASCRVP